MLWKSYDDLTPFHFSVTWHTRAGNALKPNRVKPLSISLYHSLLQHSASTLKSTANLELQGPATSNASCPMRVPLVNSNHPFVPWVPGHINQQLQWASPQSLVRIFPSFQDHTGKGIQRSKASSSTPEVYNWPNTQDCFPSSRANCGTESTPSS